MDLLPFLPSILQTHGQTVRNHPLRLQPLDGRPKFLWRILDTAGGQRIVYHTFHNGDDADNSIFYYHLLGGDAKVRPVQQPAQDIEKLESVRDIITDLGGLAGKVHAVPTRLVDESSREANFRIDSFMGFPGRIH